MDNCKGCKHAIFDEKWGEYKCKVREITIYILLDSSECTHFEKKKEDKTQGS